MMIMPSNHSSRVFHALRARFPANLGWLMGPGNWKNPPAGLTYAVDNGRYAFYVDCLAAAALANRPPTWNEAEFERLVCRATDARWIAVPDVVADREATLRDWEKHAPWIAALGRTLAFVVQDGMTPRDVPKEAAVVFVGGSKEWKWQTLTVWTRHFPRVHVGKVNSFALLRAAHHAGAESVDGSGWFRGNGSQIAGLVRFLASINGIDGSDLDTGIRKPRRGGEHLLTGFPPICTNITAPLLIAPAAGSATSANYTLVP